MTKLSAYRSVQPSTGKLLQSYPEHSDVAVAEALDKAASAFRGWRSAGFADRARVIDYAGALLAGNVGASASIVTEEMGKPRAEAESEVSKCADACRYYASNAELLLATESVEMGEGKAEIRHEPLGIILAVMPWNFPFWQSLRCAVPALMAGNCVILKPAPSTAHCGIEIERLLRQAGLPEGVFQTLLLSDEQVERLLRDPRIAGLSFTGSVRAGRQVAKVAGESLKPYVLELGGSDPFIVFNDVDVIDVAQAAVAARCFNNGQSCISPKRIFVQESIYERFVEHFVEGMKARRVGDPFDSSSENGPMAREDLRRTLAAQVEKSVSLGAKLLCGGNIPEGPGFYFPPTVLTNVTAGMPAFDEELFGPVGVVMPFREQEDLLPLANHPQYALGATIWTNNESRARPLLSELEAGAVYVNMTLKSDPRLPFGGMKCSGVGRELGQVGIKEFTNTKAVWLK